MNMDDLRKENEFTDNNNQHQKPREIYDSEATNKSEVSDFDKYKILLQQYDESDDNEDSSYNMSSSTSGMLKDSNSLKELEIKTDNNEPTIVKHGPKPDMSRIEERSEEDDEE